jgi:NifU-like protein involved in Fe-S cluster formation
LPVATVYDYFERALRRPLADVVAEPVMVEDQRAAFQLQTRGDVITGAWYQTTSCVTLMALCQCAAEWLTGTAIAEASGLRTEQLLGRLPGIPVERRGRAELVVKAVHQAVEQLRRNKA